MHYYRWHFADYMSHTGHLSEYEDLAYRRMLDLCYMHETPLASEPAKIARDIRMRRHTAAVAAVLAEFFELTPGGYVNKRVQAELSRYQAKQQQASNAGRASAQRRLNGRATESKRPSNGTPTDEPPTTTQYPITSTQYPFPPTPVHVSGGAEGASPPGSESEQTAETGAGPPAAAVALQRLLLAFGYRSKLKPHERARHLLAKAVDWHVGGMQPRELKELAGLAEGSGKDPAALLAWWLDSGSWREVLDEQRLKAKERGARTREATADEPQDAANVAANILDNLRPQP